MRLKCLQSGFFSRYVLHLVHNAVLSLLGFLVNLVRVWICRPVFTMKLKQKLKSHHSAFSRANAIVLFNASAPYRSLGVHFSKVRSLTLDTWEPELLKVSEEMLYKHMHMKCGRQTHRDTFNLNAALFIHSFVFFLLSNKTHEALRSSVTVPAWLSRWDH